MVTCDDAGDGQVSTKAWHRALATPGIEGLRARVIRAAPELVYVRCRTDIGNMSAYFHTIRLFGTMP